MRVPTGSMYRDAASTTQEAKITTGDLEAIGCWDAVFMYLFVTTTKQLKEAGYLDCALS